MEPELPKARVLIVDDEEVNRNILSDRMIALGHESVLAEDGPAALASIEQNAPDLILLDMMMPGI